MEPETASRLSKTWLVIHVSTTAISRKDFLSKIYIALKECSETQYWLELLRDTDYITEEMFVSIQNDCEELRKMLSSSTKTMKEEL